MLRQINVIIGIVTAVFAIIFFIIGVFTSTKFKESIMYDVVEMILASCIVSFHVPILLIAIMIESSYPPIVNIIMGILFLGFTIATARNVCRKWNNAMKKKDEE